MAIPKLSKKDIISALEYIDENGVPIKNQSTMYELSIEDGKLYPPKYVVAVANYIANGTEISTEGFNTIEAKIFLEGQGFFVKKNDYVKYKLFITADNVESTDDSFSMDNIWAGDNFRPLEVYLERGNGEKIKRKHDKGEKRISGQTMPRIAFQLYESQISSMTTEEKHKFPVCRYSTNRDLICGIFSSREEFWENYKNTREFMTYYCADGRQFVIYCWNVFSTIVFVQECLKRFGDKGDQFVLTYRGKNLNEKDKVELDSGDENEKNFEYRNKYSYSLIESKNIILHGAPGTGKSYLAKEIATDIISNGYLDDYTLLSDEQKEQIEFVQFHPSYDYSDFVEGLRPKINDDGSMGFELKDGNFKNFVMRARKNYENSQKSRETIEKEAYSQELLSEFLSGVEFGVTEFETSNKNKFYITGVDDNYIRVLIPGNACVNKLTLNMSDIKLMIESGENFEKVQDITTFFNKKYNLQVYSYYYAIYNKLKGMKELGFSRQVNAEEIKKYIFIIDEINRGEISKIFGELFYSIDPGYRGRSGEILTQYSNLHSNPEEKFYIPDNVYIIGTMNDIDRSVDSFDFAMRRRFRFIELKADECLEMLDSLDEDLKVEAIGRMTDLNKEIANVEELNENYQIGAAYFLKIKQFDDFNRLWTDNLKPLLEEYIQGMYDEEGIMKRFEKAYRYNSPMGSDVDEDSQY